MCGRMAEVRKGRRLSLREVDVLGRVVLRPEGTLFRLGLESRDWPGFFIGALIEVNRLSCLVMSRAEITRILSPRCVNTKKILLPWSVLPRT